MGSYGVSKKKTTENNALQFSVTGCGVASLHAVCVQVSSTSCTGVLSAVGRLFLSADVSGSILVLEEFRFHEEMLARTNLGLSANA